MSFSLKIKGEFLQLPANARLQLDQLNHLLQLGNELAGEHSLPLTVELTDVNARLLKYLLLPSIEKNTAGIEAELWVYGLPHSRGLIKLEQHNGHFNFPQRGNASIYYVFKLGAFWQAIKDKTLRDVNYGAGYSFPWNGFDVDGPNTGFIGHVTTVMNNSDVAAFDYAFFPVVNDLGLAGQQSQNAIINCCAPIGATVIPTRYSPDHTAGTSILYYNQYSPFPYHRFILQKLFTSFGWSISGTPLQDPDFLKTVFIHGAGIAYQLSAASGSMNITWDFKTMLPKLGLGNYLISLANRFGWWYDFDDNSRTLTVKYRKDILSDRKKKDYTGKTTAAYHSRISKGKIYRLDHAGATEALDLSFLQYQGEVNNQYNLPVPTTAMQNHLWLVRAENAFYNCVVDSTNTASWEKASDNLANYVPDEATETLNTNMQLPGSVFIPYRNTAMTELAQKVVVPQVTISDGEEVVETFYTAFFYGVQSTINNVAAGDYNYPFASAANYAPNGTRLGNYALSWKFANGDEDEGIYMNFLKLFLEFIKQVELVTMGLRWNLVDVLNYRYENTLVVRNTEYLISNLKVTLPLPELTEAELIRVT